MSTTVVQTDGAPAAIGPYSQAIIANGVVYTAGQVAMNPETRTLVEGDVQAQTAQVLRNLQAVLRAAGTDLDRVVKTTVYLKDLNDFAAMNETYRTFFSANPPARTTIQAGRLPMDALVEIDCIAIL